MSHLPGTLDHLLAEAVGDGDAIARDLRALFLASATAHVAAMSRAEGVQCWRDEALRLRGLVASFGMTALMDAAGCAAGSDPDPLRLDAVAAALAGCR